MDGANLISAVRILIIKPSSLGDVIHALRVVAQIKNQMPNAKIDWVIKKELEEIISSTGLIDRVFLFSRGKGFFDYLRLIIKIRRTRYDFVLDLQGLLRSAVILKFSSSVKKLGRADGKELSTLFYESVGEKSREKSIHAIDRIVPFIKSVGLTQFDHSLPLYFPNSRLDDGVKKSIPQEKFILLFPESRRKEKIWPKFNRLVDELNKLFPSQVVVAGNEKVDNFGKVTDLRGSLKLKELPSLIGRAKLIIANDSAPLHIASAMGKPLVGLFGPTESSRYGPYPYGQKCTKIFTGSGNDINSISVQAVLKSIQNML